MFFTRTFYSRDEPLEDDSMELQNAFTFKYRTVNSELNVLISFQKEIADSSNLENC